MDNNIIYSSAIFPTRLLLHLAKKKAELENCKGVAMGILGGIIGLVIAFVIAAAVLPVALTELQKNASQTGINGSVRSLLEVVPILIPVLLIMGAVGYLAFR